MWATLVNFAVLLHNFGRRDQTAQVTELGSTLTILRRPRKSPQQLSAPWQPGLGTLTRRPSSQLVPVTDLLTAADGDAVPCHCPAQRARRSCFEALLETSAVLVLAALLATKWLDTDATDEARSLTVVTVRVLCGSCCAPSHSPLDAADPGSTRLRLC